MGLSSKLVSQDMLEWGQNLMQPPKTAFPMKRELQQQSEPALKCPRCDSTNTKFCYYNNYNKTQPRHFCKACKRHWTKGGTLRNVPIGGIRKNKKIKTSNTNLDDQVDSNNRSVSTIQNQKLSPNDDNDQKGVSDFFSQPQFCSSPYLDAINNNNNGAFLGSNMPSFPFSSSTSFARNNNPSSILACFETCIGYDHYNEGMNNDSTTNVIMEMPTSYWCGATANITNWDDFDTFATSTDVNIPWYDSNVKTS